MHFFPKNRYLLLSLAFLLSNAFAADDKLMIVRGEGNWPPHEFYMDGKLSGFHIDVIQAVARKTGIEVEINTMPWVRALKTVRLAEADAISYVAKNEERTKYILFSEHNILSGTDHFLIKNSKRTQLKYNGNIRELEGLSIVHIDGYSLGKSFHNNKLIKKTAVIDGARVVELIAKNRHDYGVVSKIDVQNIVGADIMSNIVFLDEPIYSSTVYLGFSKKMNHNDIALRFTNGMRQFKSTKEYRLLQEKYRILNNKR